MPFSFFGRRRARAARLPRRSRLFLCAAACCFVAFVYIDHALPLSLSVLSLPFLGSVSYVPVHVPHGDRYSSMSIADLAQCLGAGFVFPQVGSSAGPSGVLQHTTGAGSPCRWGLTLQMAHVQRRMPGSVSSKKRGPPPHGGAAVPTRAMAHAACGRGRSAGRPAPLAACPRPGTAAGADARGGSPRQRNGSLVVCPNVSRRCAGQRAAAARRGRGYHGRPRGGGVRKAVGKRRAGRAGWVPPPADVAPRGPPSKTPRQVGGGDGVRIPRDGCTQEGRTEETWRKRRELGEEGGQG